MSRGLGVRTPDRRSDDGTVHLPFTDALKDDPRRLGDVAQAMHHFQQSIRHKEVRGDTYGAGTTRYNIARLLMSAGRSDDAVLYARAALANFQAVGPGAARRIKATQNLIHALDESAAQ